MPFEQKYSPETREASLARIVERRASEPGNRAIIRETAEEFQVGEQSLRGWIRVWEKANITEKPAAASAEEVAPAAVPEPTEAVAAQASPATPAAPRRGPGRPSAAAASETRVAELEAEVQKLRRDREALKNALAVLLGD
jgi:transposase-like protein